MKFFRKTLLPFAVLALAAFLSILAIAGFHHHNDQLESHNDCSICAWQISGSQAVSAPAPPMLFHTLVFVFISTFLPLYFSTVFFSSPGRSPPTNLL